MEDGQANIKSCWHPKREKETTKGCEGRHNHEITKRQARAKMKTISVGVSLSCMVVDVKGCVTIFFLSHVFFLVTIV